MPRRARVFVEGLTYHVYNRVGRGEVPFKLEGEAERFCSLLHEVKKRIGTWYHLHTFFPTGSVRSSESAELLDTVCSCSPGQITHALYEIGGQYRRSM